MLAEGLRRLREGRIEEIREEDESLPESGEAPISLSLERSVSEASARGRVSRSPAPTQATRRRVESLTLGSTEELAKGSAAANYSAELPNLSRLNQRGSEGPPAAEAKRGGGGGGAQPRKRAPLDYSQGFGRSFHGLSRRLLASSAERHHPSTLPFARTLRAPSSRLDPSAPAHIARNARKSHTSESDRALL